jgi:hypothetical protein
MAKRNAALEALEARTTVTTEAVSGEGVRAPDDRSAKVVTLARPKADKPDVARVMLYLHPKVVRKVKEIALHEDCKAHDIYLKALDAYLRERGFGGLTDIAAR